MGEYRLVGGPMDGESVDFEADMISMAGHRGVYVRDRRLITGIEEWQNPFWWMRNEPKPEPVYETVYEWHRTKRR